MPTLTINGRAYAFDCAPDTPLLWVIRDGAGLTGTRPGCLVGLCGACTVHVDGEAVRPCCVPVSAAEGAAVTTIEALHRTRLGRALHRAWTEGGLQSCEQCRPGRIMAAAAVLARCPEASDDEIEAAVGGHVCDCGDLGDIGDIGVALRHAARSAAEEAERGGERAVDA